MQANDMNELKPKYKLTIESRFTYHAPKDGQPERYTQLRDKAKELAYMIWELTPDSDERRRSLEKLDEVIMLANAAIARNE
jgi:hypothetical protein